ncbi:MAG: hypothetical protein GF346_08475 [Candidatus Eisenbacteria bacterium]|nr:hypothetical protein [Candidatus Latescibacterota bacterium]MBD3302469.1 hypothetical protein [Candidatus Eisenbacteria bacterium]
MSARVPVPGASYLRVVDVRGREVALVEFSSRPAGLLTFVWDGKDRRGEPVAAGLYFLRLVGPSGRSWSGQVVRIR